MSFLGFISETFDIQYHLALEEFLLKNKSENFFFLWRSNPCVVIGKHQNPYKELDIPLCYEHNVPVARRISGGGTVYHDLGNINFTIIKNTEEGKQIDLKAHSSMVFNALKELGFNIEYSSKNDFLIDGKKFSGNAEHVYKNRVLHHGTLLYNADLTRLKSLLKDNRKNIEDKTIDSNRSQVCNLKLYDHSPCSTTEFTQRLFSKITETNNIDCIPTPFHDNIIELRDQKFKTEEWIFDYTPKYKINKSIDFEGKALNLSLEVLKGTIEKFQLLNVDEQNMHKIEKLLLNQKHRFSNINSLLKNTIYSNISHQLF
ncbi:MAG: lipoate--protein ligase [Bacteroidales bacterium]|nr:lipoate--protein ligase [Bacteroidales bacterium]